MSGDCGHGWGFHVGGADGPCGLCLSNENATLRQRAERAEAENERNLSALYAKEGALVAAQSTIAELTATVERQVGALRTAVLALAHANTELAPGLYDKAYNAVSDELARAALGEP